MAIRNIRYQLEARLQATGGGFFSKPSGKLERKSYDESVERLKVTVKNLKVPDNSTAVVTADGSEVVSFTIIDGRGKYDEESDSSDRFSILEVNQTIEVHAAGEVLLTGRLYVD